MREKVCLAGTYHRIPYYPDKVVNAYGSTLLSLCKSSGKEFYWRHKHALDRYYAFWGGIGLRVVDYFISTQATVVLT